MHVGSSEIKSKNEASNVLHNKKKKLKNAVILTEDSDIDSEFILETTKNKIKIEDTHAEAPETKYITVYDHGGAVNFNDKFICLRLFIKILIR